MLLLVEKQAKFNREEANLQINFRQHFVRQSFKAPVSEQNTTDFNLTVNNGKVTLELFLKFKNHRNYINY